MEAFIVDFIRTPIGRYGGVLSSIRTDDLAALPIRTLLERHREIDPAAIDEVILGCANQAGEDNRNVARMGNDPCGLQRQFGGNRIEREREMGNCSQPRKSRNSNACYRDRFNSC